MGAHPCLEDRSPSLEDRVVMDCSLCAVFFWISPMSGAGRGHLLVPCLVKPFEPRQDVVRAEEQKGAFPVLCCYREVVGIKGGLVCMYLVTENTEI